MSTHNIGFYEEISKLSLNYQQIPTLSLLLLKLRVSVDIQAWTKVSARTLPKL